MFGHFPKWWQRMNTQGERKLGSLIQLEVLNLLENMIDKIETLFHDLKGNELKRQKWVTNKYKITNEEAKEFTLIQWNIIYLLMLFTCELNISCLTKFLTQKITSKIFTSVNSSSNNRQAVFTRDIHDLHIFGTSPWVPSGGDLKRSSYFVLGILICFIF